MKVGPLRGMKDFLPKDFSIHKYIERIAFQTACLYGYEGLQTPILENISVFDKTLGDASDIIEKEIYHFHDKKDRHVALRPEFTAGVMRAVISNNIPVPSKLFSSGPLFRYDRPQEGRQRQFHQLNFEHIGANTPYSDAEVVSLAAHILDRLDILKDVVLEINSLGCDESRSRYQSALQSYFTKYQRDLSADSQRRLKVNPLRILDSKEMQDREICTSAPVISDFYTKQAAEYFEQILNHLEQLNVQYTINTRLARGLDYYCHTAFEFTTDKLGAQSTVLAGGRYDGLSKLMGGSEIAAIGFAAGIERIALMRDFSQSSERPVHVLPIDSNDLTHGIEITDLLRKSNIKVNLDTESKIAKRIQRAVKSNASFIVFIGSDEIKSGQYKIKNLDTQVEQFLDRNNLIESLSQISSLL